MNLCRDHCRIQALSRVPAASPQDALPFPRGQVSFCPAPSPSPSGASFCSLPPPGWFPLAPGPGPPTMGFLNSLGLMQRTKKGWQAPRVRISSSSDRLNWLLSVGERFLVSAPWGDGPQRWEGLTCAPQPSGKGSRRRGQRGQGLRESRPGKLAGPAWGISRDPPDLGWRQDPRHTHPGAFWDRGQEEQGGEPRMPAGAAPL